MKKGGRGRTDEEGGEWHTKSNGKNRHCEILWIIEVGERLQLQRQAAVLSNEKDFAFRLFSQRSKHEQKAKPEEHQKDWIQVRVSILFACTVGKLISGRRLVSLRAKRRDGRRSQTN
jgi:hypothetical protein